MKKIPVLIVSGFLGSGKTTFIQQLIKEAAPHYQMMVIENDFGQVNFDANLLSKDGIAVRELTSGCICCSLVGDFQVALKDVLSHTTAEFIVIEPSGVAKLSDIIRVCEDPDIQARQLLLGSITIVDAQRAPLYVNNFGEFFKDQVKYAQSLLLSHAEELPSQTEKSIELLQNLAPNTPIHQESWQDLCLFEDLGIKECLEQEQSLSALPPLQALGEHEHSLPIFASVTLKLTGNYSKEQCEEKLAETIKLANILRLKGYVPASDGQLWQIQHTPTSTKLDLVKREYCVETPALTIIGTKLHGGAITRVWEEL